MKKSIVYIFVILVLLISNIFLIGKYVINDSDSLEKENSSGESIKSSGDKSGDNYVPEVQKDPTEVIEKEEVVEDSGDDEKLVDASYDVIVFGAEPEGIATAISAARNGKQVLMLERRDGPGGLMIYAMLNTLDMSYNTDKVLLTQGIFEEFFENFGEKDSFDVEEVRKVFEDMIAAEKNLTTIYNINC